MATINDLVLRLEEVYAKKVFDNRGKISDIINDDYVKEHVAWVKGMLTTGKPEVDLKSTVFEKLEDSDIRTAMEAFFGEFGSIEGTFEKVGELYKAAFTSPTQYVQATGRIATAQQQLLVKMKGNLILDQYKMFFSYWQNLRKNFGDKVYQAPATSEGPPVTTKETPTKSTGVSIFTNYNVVWEYWKQSGPDRYERLDNGVLTEENFSNPDNTIFGRRETPPSGVFPQIRDGKVSRKHGQILLINGGITYKDLDSTNGSLAVNCLHKACNGRGIEYELIPGNVEGDEKDAAICFGKSITPETKRTDLPYILKIIAKKK